MHKAALLGLPFLVLLGILAFGAYQYHALAERARQVAERATQDNADSEATIARLATELDAKEAEARTFADALYREQDKNEVFERQLRDLSGTVGTLEKLAKTDPELLAKYSKVYFLNENYAPARLAPIDETYAFEEGRTYEMHADVLPVLEDLLADAAEDGL